MGLHEAEAVGVGRVLVHALADVIDGTCIIGAAGAIIEARLFFVRQFFTHAAGAGALLFTVRARLALADAGLGHGLAHLLAAVSALGVDLFDGRANLRAFCRALRAFGMPLTLE